MSQLGKNLKLIRKKRGLSQIELGKLSGITERTIYNYETGDNYPKPKNLAKLAAALDVSTDFLERGDLENEPVDMPKEKMTFNPNFDMNVSSQSGEKMSEIPSFLDQAADIFGCSSLSESIKDEIFESIAHSYFLSKRKYRLKRSF